jgi:hypothetical protein
LRRGIPSPDQSRIAAISGECEDFWTDGHGEAGPRSCPPRRAHPGSRSRRRFEHLDQLQAEEWTRDETMERMRALYQYRKRRFAARAGKIEDEGFEDRALTYQQMVQSVLAAQREALLRMRREGELSNEAMNRIVRELDLEESRLEI